MMLSVIRDAPALTQDSIFWQVIGIGGTLLSPLVLVLACLMAGFATVVCRLLSGILLKLGEIFLELAIKLFRD